MLIASKNKEYQIYVRTLDDGCSFILNAKFVISYKNKRSKIIENIAASSNWHLAWNL